VNQTLLSGRHTQACYFFEENLLELIDKYGMKWSVVSRKIGGIRTRKQIREHYLNKLNPDFKASK
jgi:hypothetical protein